MILILAVFSYKGCQDRNRYIKRFRIKGSPRQRDSQVMAQWQGRCTVLILPWFVNLYPALYVLFKRIFRIQSSPLRSLSKTEMPNLLTTVSGNQGYPKATHPVNNLRKTTVILKGRGVIMSKQYFNHLQKLIFILSSIHQTRKENSKKKKNPHT